MSKGDRKFFFAVLVLALTGAASSDPLTYQQEFTKDVSIMKSSSVPVVDRYFRYVIEQAAPFQPLANHYDPVPEEITVTQEFRLDAGLWKDGISSTRPCDELKPRSSQPD